MIRTICWFTYFWVFAIFSIFLLIPYGLLRVLKQKLEADRYLKTIVTFWSKSLIAIAGGQVRVHGIENVPSKTRICYIANHQGNFDIPLTLAYLPGLIGYIAKKELRRMPIINLWMHAIGCIFIDRKDRRAAVAVIRKGVEAISGGRNLLLFPEGTRSQGPELKHFKSGSLKLPIRAEATIIPVSISGSYKLLEQTGRMTPAEVHLTIHPPVAASKYSEDETKELAEFIKDTIRSGIQP